MKKYQDKMARTVYEMAEGLYKIGAIDAKRMHEYDVECLVPSAVPLREATSGGSENRPHPVVAASHA
jgi:DNA-binding transcriptional regulator YiaG